MTSLHIVIVSYNWPPRNAIGTHRPYSWAKYWSQQGAKITVLTSKKKKFDEPLDLNLQELPGVEVYEVEYLNKKYRPYFLLKNALVYRLAKLARDKFSSKSRMPIDIRNKWIKPSLPLARELAEQADVVVSTFGPSASHLIALEMKKTNPKIFWVADYRDLWSMNHLSVMTKSQKCKVKELELNTVGNADLLTTVSNDIANQLISLFPKKEVNVISNGFDTSLENFENKIDQLYTKTNIDTKRVVYTGRIYICHRNPIPIFEAILSLENKKLISKDSITIDFYGTSSDLVKELVNDKPEYKSFIRFMGHVPREEALKAQGEASLLLLLESSSPEVKGVLTGKIFEYIASGTPILSLGSLQYSAIFNLLTSTKTGVCLQESIDSIEELLLMIVKNETPSWFEPSLKEIKKYSRKEQAIDMYNQIIKKTT